MILTYDDLSTYLPSLIVTEEEITPYLYYVQAIIEDEAQRSLEITEYTEKLRLAYKLQNVYLSYSPIVAEPPPVVKVRMANAQTALYDGIMPTDWITLADTEYLIDSDNQLHIQKGLNSFYFYPQHSQEIIKRYIETEVTYSAGIDFSEDTTEVRNIKATSATILSYLRSGQFQGISSIQVPFDEFSISFGKVESAKIPEGLLKLFRSYRPLSRVI